MKVAKPFYMIAALALLSGCAKMKVTSDRTDYDFSAVKTYEWIPGPADILGEEDTYLSEEIQQALNNQLSAKGWKQVLAASEASIQVAYYVKLAEHKEYANSDPEDQRDFAGGFVYNQGNKNWRYEEREPNLQVYTVETGTLTVLMHDAKSGEQIWRGSLETKLDRTKPMSEQKDALRKVSRALLDKVPTK